MNIYKLIFFGLLFVRFSIASSQVNFSHYFFKEIELISFGEASHGSKSDYKIRSLLIDSLISEGEELDVIIEMPFSGGNAIRRFLSYEIDTAELVKELQYFGLSTYSFLELIDKYKHNSNVNFHGIDIQVSGGILRDLSNFLQTNITDQASREQIQVIYDSLKLDFLDSFSVESYLEYKGAISRNLKLLDEIVENHDSQLSLFPLKVKVPLIVLRQSFRFLDLWMRGDHTTGNAYRDSCMAANTKLIKECTNNRILIFSANAHCLNFPQAKTMGYYLKQQFGDKYYIIFSQYYCGSVLEPEISNGIRTFIPKPVYPIKKSFSFRLNKITMGKEGLYVFSDESNKSLFDLYNQEVPIQIFGAARGSNKKYGYINAVPIIAANAVYFIPSVEPSVLVE